MKVYDFIPLIEPHHRNKKNNKLMNFFEFTFQSGWHFVGMAILIGGFGDWSLKIWNRFWRHWNIRKHGYPPAHCDADGDAVVEDKPNEQPKPWGAMIHQIKPSDPVGLVDDHNYCGKILYASKKEADSARKLINRDLTKVGKRRMERAYFCDRCEAWHLTTIAHYAKI